MKSLKSAAIVLVTASMLRAGGSDPSISLLTPASYLPGVPVLVRAELRHDDGSLARDVWNSDVSLTATPPGTTLTPSKVKLWNGIGSALVSVQGSGDVTITAALGAVEAQNTLKSLAGQPVTNAPGTIAGPVTEWSGIVHVTGSVTVPAGVTLRILPGTLVLVDGVATSEIEPGECESVSATPTKCGKSITVRGAIESMGTGDEPVTITASDPTKAWGEIIHDNAAQSFYDFTVISRAGNSPRGGHTNTGPTIRATNSRIRFDDSSIADTAGKCMIGSGSDLQFHNTLITRCKTGPEIDGTALIFDHSYALEMKGKPPLIDDNDGIYIHDQRPGQTIALNASIFADCDDDGIDTLGPTMTVEDCIIRDNANPNEDSKGISVFSGEVDVKNCLLVNNKVGISAKSQNGGTATVRIDQSTIFMDQPMVGTVVPVGIQAQDKFHDGTVIHIKIFVNSSVVRAPDAVKTDYPQFPGDVQIYHSDLSETWTGTGNITLDPLFVDAAGRDFRLQPTSPCIDAGDPALMDPDGTRADMGVYPFTAPSGSPSFVRGRVNEDTSVDIADSVALLLHLFSGRAVACEEAADANDDGSLNVTDALFLLDYLFRDGPALPPPAVGCGVDPTADALGCASTSCG